MWNITYRYFCSATMLSNFFFLKQERKRQRKPMAVRFDTNCVNVMVHKWWCIHNMLPVWPPRPPAALMCFLMPTLARFYITWRTHVLHSSIGYVDYDITPSGSHAGICNCSKIMSNPMVLFSPGNDTRALPLSIPLSVSSNIFLPYISLSPPLYQFKIPGRK